LNIIDRDRVARAKADILHVFEQIKTLVVEKKEDLVEFVNQIDAFLKEG
jgi:hypothetical protein